MEDNIFERQSIPKTYAKLAVPLVFSMVVTLVYNIADTWFIARTGNVDLVAGVSLGAPVFTALMAIGNIFGQGGSSLISRMMGKKDEQGMRRVSAFCFYAAILSGAVIGALMLVFRSGVLRLLGADTDTLTYASEYYSVLAAGAPFLVLSFIHSNLLRAEGMSKESMIGTVGGAVVNLILDPILILSLSMGAKGAAIASILGYLASDLYFLAVVCRKSRNLSVRPAECRVGRQEAGQIFGIGIPAAVTNIMSSISVILINQFLLPYGNDKIAAMGIVMKVNMIATLILTGLAFGGAPLFGYFYGAGNKYKMKELIRFTYGFICSVALVLTIVIFAAAPALIRSFLSEEAIVREGTRMLRLQVISIVCVAVVLLTTIIFQSTGKMLGSFLLSISRQGVIFILVLLAAAAIAGYNGVLVSQAVSDVLSAGFAGVLFFRQVYRELAE